MRSGAILNVPTPRAMTNESDHNADASAVARILPTVYEALRELAHRRLLSERKGHTLQTTELVHEAYLRLVGNGAAPQEWNSRGHFFTAAAEAMRRILIDHARRRHALVRGGDRARVPLDDIEQQTAAYDQRLLDLDEALTRLEALDPQKAALVKLRFFAGLTNEQAAATLEISTATAQRTWAYCRAWLRAEMGS